MSLFFNGPLFYRAYVRTVIGEPRNRFTHWVMMFYGFVLIWPYMCWQFVWPGKKYPR